MSWTITTSNGIAVAGADDGTAVPSWPMEGAAVMVTPTGPFLEWPVTTEVEAYWLTRALFLGWGLELREDVPPPGAELLLEVPEGAIS